MIAPVGFHPVPAIVGPLAENFFTHHRNAKHLANEMNHLLRSGQPVQVAVDDDAVETVVYKSQQTAKQLCEGFHRSSPKTCTQLDHRIEDRWKSRDGAA